MERPSKHSLFCLAAAILACMIASTALAQTNVVHGPMFTLTGSATSPNGAWSWFEDERTIIDDTDPNHTLLIASSVSAGASPEDGDVDLLWRDLDTGTQGEFELSNRFQQDDHDSAALYIRPDGRYLAMFSKHGSDNLTHWRVSTNPHDPSAWGTEQTLDNGAGTTYDNIYYLPNDNGGAGRTYNFTRADGFDPIIQTSSDNGSTWAETGRLLTEGGSSDRPYVRYASDGKKIHVLTTDRHPRDFPNSIYHGYVQNGVLYKTDGTVDDSNLFDGNGMAPSTLTPVFKNGSQFGNTTMNRAWTINLEIDNTGNPVAIFTARANDSDLDHRFFYARYDGSAWQVNEMARAGGYLYAAENDYTGLASIDPSNPNVVYMSSNIDPRNNSGTARYELYKGTTIDFGKTWAWAPITENSTVDNVRPVVANWNGQNTSLSWMRGTYTAYTNWSTQVVALSFASMGPRSLLWRGDAPSATAWDGNSTANWDSGGHLVDKFQNQDEVAFDDTATTFTVNLPASVSPSGTAFNNAVHAYTVTGAGISGGGSLRVIGGAPVTFANSSNTYTGDTLIARGTLAISGPTTLSGTPHIRVAQQGTFDVTAATGNSYTLSNQALTIDGTVNGNITATNNSIVEVNSANAINGNLAATNSTVIASGKISGSFTAAAGSIVQIGGEITSTPQFTYLDATHGAGGNTTLSDGSVFVPTTNPNWQIRGIGNGTEGSLANNGSVYQGSSDNPASAPELRTTISGLVPGRSYSVYANYWDASGSTWRILAGASSGNLALFDSPLDNVAGATGGIDPKSLNYVNAPLTAEGNRLMWGAPLGLLVADSNGQIKVYVNDTGTADGDDRTWYDGLSYSSGRVYSGQGTMTVGGNFTMDSQSALQLDIASPSAHDLLKITGHLNAAGEIDVHLAESALALQADDTFDILDFASASGSFAKIGLPALAAGLAWKTADLLTTGMLEVVIAPPGDYNQNTFVDAADFVTWRKNDGTQGGYNMWRENFGQASASIPPLGSNVPEPVFRSLFVAALALLGLSRTGSSHGRFSTK